ncbi:MAG: Stp1/IreP family PP2C-type Ser/Thr phosphatase [Oscillospiraceae bacterium]|nr:Stp1/IreP family PP2C-type Ser/Thr phosphatase [Oscillospiraceae bacterium]
MKFGGKSDKGLHRTKNEDAYCIIDQTEKSGTVVLAVADGMGGHKAGNVASTMAIESIETFYKENPIDTAGAVDFSSITERLGDTIRDTNESIYERSVTDPECEGMGTTLTVAVIAKENAALAHIGDSCAYHFHDGKMSKITTDHTYVEELVKRGTLSREEALIHPQRNYITKVVGCFDIIVPDFYSVDLAPEDRVLLCSDGLNKMLNDEDILQIVCGFDDPELICTKLIEAANLKGGLDNITAVVFLNLDEV